MGKIIQDRPSEASFEAMLSSEVVAVRTPGFLSPAAARELAACMRVNRLRGPYENAETIDRVGRAYFEKKASAAAAVDYAANAISWMSQIRDAVSPLQPPIDRLRLELDEMWPAGATLATIEGAKAFCGLIRIFPPGSEAEPHQDLLAWDVEEGHPDGSLRGQFAANIYLEMPPEGGELVIWPHSFEREAYEQHRRPGSYGLVETILGPPEVVIRPEPGDLVMFNSRRVHSVRPAVGGERIAASCFVGFRDRFQPLWLWS